MGNIFYLFAPVYTLWALISLWKSAFNSNWKGWGYIVRVLCVIFLVSFIAITFIEEYEELKTSDKKQSETIYYSKSKTWVVKNYV